MKATRTYDRDGNESTDLEPRDARALAECMSVLPDGPDLFTVVGENGDTYTVDAREERCTCPDHEYRDARCKHLRRVAFVTGAEPIPGWVDPDGVDSQLGEHVDATPEVAAADGGIIEADDDGEILDGAGTDAGARPDDCTCSPLFDDLPCWECFVAGFDAPNPDAEEGGEA